MAPRRALSSGRRQAPHSGRSTTSKRRMAGGVRRSAESSVSTPTTASENSRSQRSAGPPLAQPDSEAASVGGTQRSSVSRSVTTLTTPDLTTRINSAVTPAYNSTSPSTITAEDARVIQDEVNVERQNQTSVTRFIADWIFPHLKFLDGGDYSLDYSTDPKSLCDLVLKRCFRNTTMSRAWWDEKGKRYVRAAMARLRSDKMQGIKKAFNGTFLRRSVWSRSTFSLLPFRIDCRV